MRKWFYLILGHPDDEMVGNVQINDGTQGMTSARKNEVGERHKRNLETDESYVQREVGLGYADFESEADYEERIQEVLDEKLAEIDAEYVEEAGLDVPGVTA